MSARSAEAHASTFTHKQRTIALAIVAFAFVMDLLDSTIVNIAIPSIQTNLHASYAMIQWLIAGYSLTFALLLITGGRMGDVFGYKKVFLFGVAGFTVASLLSGIAPNAHFMVAARLLQGAMAALMVPQVMSLMQVMYKKHERAKTMGLFGMLGGLAASLGPIVGGLLIKANLFGWDWRPIFLINIPVGIFAFAAGWKYLPNGKSAHPLHLDIKGTALVMIALSLLIFPLIQGRDLDWPVWIFAMLAAAVPALAIFWYYERRKARRDGSALIVPSLFRLRSFNSGLILNILLQMTMIGFFLTFTLALQIGLGFDVLKAAITGIPTAIGIGLSIAVIGQQLMPKLGRYIFLLGGAILAGGFLSVGWVINHYGMHAHAWQFILPLFATGLGFGTIMTPMFSIVLQDVDTEHAGAASGILNAIQQVGGAVGVALIGVLFFGQLHHGAIQSFDQATPALRNQLTVLQLPAETQNQIIDKARLCFNDRSQQKDANKLPASCQTAGFQDAGNPTAQAAAKAVQQTALTANANNFGRAFRFSVGYELILLAIVCSISMTLPRRFRVIEETA